jgi:hypothetical protein
MGIAYLHNLRQPASFVSIEILLDWPYNLHASVTFLDYPRRRTKSCSKRPLSFLRWTIRSH